VEGGGGEGGVALSSGPPTNVSDDDIHGGLRSCSAAARAIVLPADDEKG